MSKKLWLPPTKLGHPEASRKPPVYRVRGVGDHPEAQEAILNRFAGRIGQFHMAQAHNYSLAPQAIYRGRANHPDMDLRYTNLQGQEIIEIFPHPQVVEEVKEEFIPYDWALIEFEIENTLVKEDDYLSPTYYAYLTVPRLEAVTAASEFPVKGVTASTDTTAASDERFCFAYRDTITQLPVYLGVTEDADGVHVASLRIDLSLVGPKSAVVAQIYGRLPFTSTTVDVIVDSEIGAGQNMPTDLLSGGIYDGMQFVGYTRAAVEAVHPDISAIPDDIRSVTWAQDAGFWKYRSNLLAPPPHQWREFTTSNSPNPGSTTDPNDVWDAYPELSVTTFFDDTLIVKTYREQWVDGNDGDRTRWNEPPSHYISAPPPGDDYTGAWRATSFKQYFMPITEPETTQDPPHELEATVRAGVYRGTPPWAVAQYSTETPHYRWEWEGLFPDRPAMGDIGEVTLVSDAQVAEDDYTNNFGAPFLGTLTVDRKLGYAVFKPA